MKITDTERISRLERVLGTLIAASMRQLGIENVSKLLKELSEDK